MMRELEDICRFDDLMNSEHSTDRQVNRLRSCFMNDKRIGGFVETPEEGCSPHVPDMPAIEGPLC